MGRFQRPGGGPRPWHGVRSSARVASSRRNVLRHQLKVARLGYSGKRPLGRRAHIGYDARGGTKSRRACLMGRHPEKKFIDGAIDATPSTTGTFSLLSTIPQGADESERVGRKTIITDILLRGHILWGSTTGAAPLTENRFRLMVVQDKQPNKAIFAVTDLLETADINSYRNLAQAKRFEVLFDRTYTRSAVAGHGDGTTNDFGTVMFPFNINLKPCIDMEYSGADGAIDKQTVNSVHALMFEETGSPGTLIHGATRLRFVE